MRSTMALESAGIPSEVNCIKYVVLFCFVSFLFFFVFRSFYIILDHFSILSAFFFDPLKVYSNRKGAANQVAFHLRASPCMH